MLFNTRPKDTIAITPFSSRGFWLTVFRQFAHHPLALSCLVVLILLALMCVLIPIFSANDYSATHFESILSPPNATYWFGTDGLGRDLWVRCFIGGRVTFEIALAATCVILLIGVMYGATAGFLGGMVDNIMMRAVDVLYGIPFLFFCILLLSLFGQTKLVSFMAIATLGWLDMARVVRGQTLNLKQQEFVEAAKISGLNQWQIIFRHIIPNLLGIVIIYSALTIPSMIVLSAVLSFFGLGVMEPMTSWGLLISDGVADLDSWWLLLFPASLMTLTLLCFAFVANGLRDTLDPR